jgi:hypothetical protein
MRIMFGSGSSAGLPQETRIRTGKRNKRIIFILEMV